MMSPAFPDWRGLVLARVGDQSDGVRKQAIDHFCNDEAEIERSANGERYPKGP
jgi:hypothetical protein